MAFNRRDWANGERITEALLDNLEDRIEQGLAEVPVEVTDPLVSTLVDDDFSTTTSSIKARVEGWVADGTIPTAEPAGLTVTETQPGAYSLESGATSATIYGLTASQLLPPAAESKLASDATNGASALGGALVSKFATLDAQGRQPVRKGELVYSVTDFGANGADITDDTAAVQAAVDAAVADGGGSVFFPKGRYIISAPIVVTGRPVRLFGVSPMASVIETSASIDMIVLDGGESSAGDGCVVEGLRVQNPGNPTAGAAIVLKSGFGHRLTHLRLGHYDCVRVENAYGYVIDGGSYLLARGRYGVYNRSIQHPDRGDSTIIGNVFNDATGRSVAAICLESGGGLKVIGNKILQHQFGVLLQPEEYTTTLAVSAAAGATSVTLANGTGLSTNGQLFIGGSRYTVLTFNRDTGAATLASGLLADAASGAQVLVGIATSVFPITGNSMEGQKVAHVKAKRKGSVGRFSFFSFEGGQFNGSAANGTITDGFLVGAGADHGTIVGATMYGRSGATAFHFEDGADNWNVDSTNTAAYLNGVMIDAGAVDIQVGEGNKYRNNVTYPLVNNMSSTSVSPTKQSRFSRYTGYISSSTTYSALFRLDCLPARSFMCDLVVEGTAQSGVGPVFRRILLAVTRPVSGAAQSTVQVISDDSAGVPIDILFDTAAVVGAVYIRVRRDPLDGAVGFSGTATIRVDGNLSRIQIP